MVPADGDLTSLYRCSTVRIVGATSGEAEPLPMVIAPLEQRTGSEHKPAALPSRPLATVAFTEPVCSHAALAAPRSTSNSAIIGNEMTKKVPPLLELISFTSAFGEMYM